jgi:hypothetical protein
MLLLRNEPRVQAKPGGEIDLDHFARLLGVDTRKARAFLREIYPKRRNPHDRWSIPVSHLPDLINEFDKRQSSR